MINLVLMGVVAGVVGTLVMDTLNYLLARTGLLLKIDIGMIGRMTAGWIHGRFRYGHPGEMEQDANEMLYGYITHYTISVAFALIYVFGWDLLVGGPASPLWALIFGVATTVAPQFLVLPSMGLGVFGRRSPEGIRAPLSSLANHLFFGMGMSITVAFM